MQFVLGSRSPLTKRVPFFLLFGLSKGAEKEKGQKGTTGEPSILWPAELWAFWQPFSQKDPLKTGMRLLQSDPLEVEPCVRGLCTLRSGFRVLEFRIFLITVFTNCPVTRQAYRLRARASRG